MQHTKSKKGKRLLGIVISCAMLFGMFPGMSVSAAEPEIETINLLDYRSSRWRRIDDIQLWNKAV